MDRKLWIEFFFIATWPIIVVFYILNPLMHCTVFDFILLTFIQVVEMTRFIEVSHWGNIAVEESFTLKHVGALLKVNSCLHEYSRY